MTIAIFLGSLLAAMALVGHIKGGLGYVTIVAAVIMASLSGSAVADAAALTALMLAIMVLMVAFPQIVMVPARWFY